MANNIIRAASYVRSATEEGSTEALKHQAERIREYAAQNGSELVREYSDVGAGMPPYRRGLHQLEADARLGVYDVLIVYERSRLFRDRDKLRNYLRHLEALGIKVEFVVGVGR